MEIRCLTGGGACLFIGPKPEWILEKPTDWKDSIVYKGDVR